MSFREVFEAAARASGKELEPRVAEACAVHFELLLRWNRTHNLTRITDPSEAATKHYLDCLVPLLDARAAGLTPPAFVDVGSGAGFPGLLACLVWPEARAVLVEPAQKRASFLTIAGKAMGVGPEVRPVARGAEGIVLSRATFSPGRRGELLAAAVHGIAVWGHRHDTSTWREEVATWSGWRPTFREYRVAGLEPRVLLWAVSGGFHVEHSEPIM